jgi:hypothetical protein
MQWSDILILGGMTLSVCGIHFGRLSHIEKPSDIFSFKGSGKLTNIGIILIVVGLGLKLFS